MKKINFINKNTKKVILLLLVSLTAIVTSCNNELLEKKPLNSLSEDVVFTDPVFLQNYVYNVYNGMKTPWTPGSGGYEAMTDLAVSSPDTHNRAAGIREYIEGNMSPDNILTITDTWNYQYDYIKRVNVFFEKVENSAIPADKLNPMKGEMHFLRAWMYFELIRTFGGVPIITKSFTLNDTSFEVTRNTYDECTKFILDECDKAISLLVDAKAPSGKISKNATLALKARVLLNAASPLNNPTNNIAKWQAAEAATKAVLNLGYTLHPTHDDLLLKPVKEDETIFGRAFTSGTRIPDWGLNYDYWPSGFDARQRLNPTQTFVNMFQLTNGKYPYLADGITVNTASGYDAQNPFIDRDPRFYSSIIYPGAGPFSIKDDSKSTERVYEYWEDANPNPDNAPPYANPNKVDKYNGQTLFDFGRDSKTYWVKGLTPFHWRVQTGYTFRKLLDFSGPRASFDFDYNQVVVYMRLAEFYLNYAEIQLALGNEVEARNYINKVRQRPSVNMPDITSSGAELVREYRNERAVELHLEDIRFYDLMRWKAAPGNIDIPIRGLTSVTMDWTNAQEGDYVGKLNFTYGVISEAEVRAPWKGDYYYLFPIPREEIQRSNNKIVQNPGYGN